MGHADGPTVGKRLRDLRSDAERYHAAEQALARIRQRRIANCRAWYTKKYSVFRPDGILGTLSIREALRCAATTYRLQRI